MSTSDSDLQTTASSTSETQSETAAIPPKDRVTRWAQKLLDLSLRNRLLNVRDSKLIIPVACPDSTKLEDNLATNQNLTLNSLENLVPEVEGEEQLQKRLSEELSHKRLWTNLPALELRRRLKALYRQGRTDLEEGGVNTIYLAIGFLEWKPTEREAKSYLAPLLLLPVRLQQKALSDGIQIQHIDEETIINETLLELLRSEFHLTLQGLTPLPTDEAGTDVGAVLKIFQDAIAERDGWAVRNEVRLGHFSFGKFIMWTDMTSRMEELKQNSLVKHLVEGGGLFDDGIEVFPPEKINEHLDLAKLYCPMNADSSQLAAILYSQMGKSFVLHGPPGTGKSQTITNIIAQNLAVGRRVLFVSEKKVALDVVYRRLSNIGLRPFCLELHSNKSGKTEVLAQFSEALQVAEAVIPRDWEQLVEELQRTRQELNEYVRALHKTYPNGFSAYDCFSRQLQWEFSLPETLFSYDCLKQTQAEYSALCRMVEDLGTAWRGTNPTAVKALRWLKEAEWSPVFERTLSQTATRYEQATSRLQQAWEDCHFAEQETLTRSALAAQAAELCLNGKPLPKEFLATEFCEGIGQVELHHALCVRLKELEEALRECDATVWKGMDVRTIQRRLEENGRKFFVTRFFGNRSLLKNLSGLKQKLTIPELAKLLPLIREYQEKEQQRQKVEPEAQRILGGHWGENWAELEPLLLRSKEIHALAKKAEMQTEEFRAETLAGYLEAWKEFQAQREAFGAFGEISCEEVSALAAAQQGILENLEELRGVLHYRAVRGQAVEGGLEKFAERLKAGEISVEDAGDAFAYSYSKRMLDQILATAPALRNFTGLNQEQRIQKFCELDDKFTSLSRKIVFAKLAATLPRRRSGPCPEGTELGILKRECEKRTRQKPVRQLLELLPKLAPVLKPCFLMSPLSVAQYLPPDSASFDLVVFDEASQIPVWDAIGVIARAKQLIVVGDPKQMPPTNFFQKGESEDTEEEVEDMESILDECLAAGVYSSYLNWHYRSRHEALIAFSNHYYYEDRLFTFPAARLTERLGMKFIYVPEGRYDRKASRTNRVEAKTLVRYVFDALLDETRKPRSIGIVTFSEAQRNLIEDLMEQERLKYPQLEKYFGEQNEEPPFVKNLENVQGDERDVILFSIGYALDSEGKFSLNFGPLNRQGGERRLNVAITRAKEQVVVFSSIHGAQIDLTRTNATGAAHLKYFLDYAEKGLQIQAKVNANKNSEGLSRTIEEFLRGNGYEVERNFGSSAYRIDLAVRNPDNPSAFLLGIECDGTSYASQRTTRDRDHLRDSVLRGLGWHTYRAWSVDWTFDRKHAEAALLEYLEQCRKEPEPKRETPKPQPVEESAPVETPKPAAPQSEIRQEYKPFSLTCRKQQEGFYEPSNREYIRDQFAKVIRGESPICGQLLKKRILKAWGFSRGGENIQRILNQCLPMEFPTSPAVDDCIYWAPEQNPRQYRFYRVPAEGGEKRAIDEIPPEELANAMRELKLDFQITDQTVLYKETMRCFGFPSVTTKAMRYLDYAYQKL